jgi:hypothetical protein
MTAVEPDARPDRRHEADAPSGRSLTSVCPYLAAADGTWRSSTVSREHRCRAVSPPAPLAAEKQRRLCLTADYPTCATFEAARAARPVAHDRPPLLPRPLARTAPVVLDHGRLVMWPPSIRADRTTIQAILVALLAIAFLAIVVARVASGQGPGAGGPDGSSAPIATPVTGAGGSEGSASARPTTPGTASPASSPRGSGGAPASPAAPGASAGQTYRVQTGDTLVGIAARFGTTAKAIAELNGMANPASLRVGQVLQIP